MREILLIDDSLTIRATIEFMLKKSGYAVRSAISAEAALQLLRGGTMPDAIITDLNMERMDGIAFIREVRKTPAHSSVPIVVLTTASSDERREEGRAAGASGWLVKPIERSVLSEVLRRLLDDETSPASR